MTRLRWWAGLAVGLLLTTGALAQVGAPTFPRLTGRIVDAADILPARTETQLTARLAALETATGRQLVVATVPTLQGYEIEEYGYRLGRAWRLGGEKADDGAILLVAPVERKVRVEVGYGLEGVLTDALSSQILQTDVLPRFRADDYPGGVVAGTDALIGHLSLPADEAAARVASAERQPVRGDSEGPLAALLPVIIFVVLLIVMNAGSRGRRRRRRGGGVWIPPVILWGGGSGGGGGFGSGGGGGFRGGGGSFGGGGASGGW